MKTILFATMLFFTINSYGINQKEFPVGKVIKIRGKISVLQPHTLKAILLKKGSFVYEDSSLLSSKASFALIKMIDGSRVTIGPKSKIVLSMVKKQGGTIISLLTGKLRASIAKKKKKHFFVKTRTAALGVRGTDFLTSYNVESRKTGLLTYNGSVAIKKVEKKIIIDNESTATQKKKVVKEITKLLEDKPILTKVGDFTNVGVMSEQAAPVVKVNIKQLTRLKLDNSLGVEKLKVNAQKIKEVEQELTKQIEKDIKQAPTKSKLTNGGLIDIDTNLYIPPAKKGTLIGKITPNGNYIPPKGLKLDAHKGFVAIKEDDQDRAEKLNEKLEDQVVPEPENPAYKRYFE
jgi:hypothetical protein